MSIGVDFPSAALTGPGAAPSLRDSAGPGAGTRQAGRFQSLVDGRSADPPAAAKPRSANEPASTNPVSRPASQDAPARPVANPKPPVKPAAGKPTSAKAAAGKAVDAPTGSAADAPASQAQAEPAVPSAKPVAVSEVVVEDEWGAGTDEAPNDSDLLAALNALFGAPAMLPVQLPAEHSGEQQDAGTETADTAVTQAAVPSIADAGMAASEYGIGEAPAPAIAPPGTTKPADTTDPAAAAQAFELATAGAVPTANVDQRPQEGRSAPKAMTAGPQPAPVPSAAARALARALGALTGQAPATATTAASSAGQTEKPVEVAPAAEPAVTPEITYTPKAAQPAKIATAINGSAAATAQLSPLSQAISELSNGAIEGALRKASTAAQGRQLAATAAATEEVVAAPPSPSSLPVAGPMRIEGIAVQGAQGSQQASVGLAPAITDASLVREGSVAEQIVKAVRIQVRDGIGEAKLSLRPDHMGEVQVQLKVEKDRVSATVVVERADVRTQIEGQGAALRAGLEAQGLHLEELVVHEDGQRRKGSEQDAPRDQSGRRRRQASDKTFDLDEA